MKENRTVSFGDFTLDLLTRQLKHPKKNIKITQRECDVLYEFIKADGKTVTNEEMLMRLWGYTDFFNARSYDVFIAKIRKYLKLDPNVQLGTVRGVGKYIKVFTEEDSLQQKDQLKKILENYK